MDLLSPSADYDSDCTLRPASAVLNGPLPPPTPRARFHHKNFISSAIEILSPSFSDSDSESEPSPPTEAIHQEPLPWYQRLLNTFISCFSSLKHYFYPPPPTHDSQPPSPTSDHSSAASSPTSSTSSGFISPGRVPPPILIPPPPSDLHLSEYFPLLSPRVGRLWKRRRTSSSPQTLNSAKFSTSTLSPQSLGSVTSPQQQIFSPQEANWPPPLETPRFESPSTPYTPEDDTREGEYVRIGHVFAAGRTKGSNEIKQE